MRSNGGRIVQKVDGGREDHVFRRCLDISPSMSWFTGGYLTEADRQTRTRPRQRLGFFETGSTADQECGLKVCQVFSIVMMSMKLTYHNRMASVKLV